jgi:acyl-coenzyme A synthetase/AMP-(fatty) acid ligase
VTRRFEELLARLVQHGAQECLVCDGQTYSATQLIAGFESARARVDSLGLDPGKVVGLRADYSLGSIAALFALLDARSTVAMLPRDRDAAPLLEDAHAAGLLEVDTKGAWHWQAAAQSPPQHPLLDALAARGEPGIVLFTSGSTGRPKAALQGLERFLYKFRKPGKRLRTLAFLLFDHVAGLDTLFYTLSSGGVVVVPRSRTPAAIARLIEEAHVEVLSASPSFLRLLCMAGNAANADLSSLKIITYGSEPMDPHTLALLNDRFPNLTISQKYGTTETGSPRSVSRGNDSLWLKLGGDGIETRVVDGVLHLRGEGTILGYLNAPSPVDAEGWYSTGDLVETDGDWIRFRGRTADRINVGGEKVSPAEVEHALLALDFIREAVVAGESNAMLGEIVTARVVLEGNIDEHAALRRIRAHCRAQLEPYKVPVKVHFEAGSLSNTRQKLQRAR